MLITEILLLCFILNLGITLGAGLYETRIILPIWFRRTANKNFEVNFDAIRTIDTGRKFWGAVTTFPLTLLTITNLIFALKSETVLHVWWLLGTLIILFERIGTFTFFIPTALKLQKGENLSGPTITRLVMWWTRLNHVRNALTFVALIILFKAILLL